MALERMEETWEGNKETYSISDLEYTNIERVKNRGQKPQGDENRLRK